MATKQEVNAMVIKILRAYPQLKFSAESITAFVEDLADELKYYPGWLLDEVAGLFRKTEIDFPKLNIASLLAYCYKIRKEQLSFWGKRFQDFKDHWYDGKIHDEKDWREIIAGFEKLNSKENAENVRNAMPKYRTPKGVVSPEQIAEAAARMKELAETKAR